MEPITPQAEHIWLHQLLGDWSFEMECVMGPDQPPTKSTGTESVKSLGGVWTLAEGTCGPGTSRTTLGYDPAQKKFVGTFVASMMTHLWTYTGSLDASGKVLTLDTVGPSFQGDGTMVAYQDIHEIVDENQRKLRSRVQSPNGDWMQFMDGTYTRQAGAVTPQSASPILPYLFFAGRCEEAMNFYREHLGAQIEMMMRFDQSPEPTPPGMLQEGFASKIMHASFTINGARIMASDGCDDKAKFDGFHLALSVSNEAEAHRAFNALANGGNVQMPLAKTFWSPCYGMVTDRFNVGWMVMVAA